MTETLVKLINQQHQTLKESLEQDKVVWDDLFYALQSYKKQIDKIVN